MWTRTYLLDAIEEAIQRWFKRWRSGIIMLLGAIGATCDFGVGGSPDPLLGHRGLSSTTVSIEKHWWVERLLVVNGMSDRQSLARTL